MLAFGMKVTLDNGLIFSMKNFLQFSNRYQSEKYMMFNARLNHTLAKDTLARHFGQRDSLASVTLAGDTLASDTLARVTLWPVTLWPE